MTSHFPNPGKYSFIPAAIKYRDEGGIGIYVKYKTKRSNEIRVISRSTPCDIVDCPDRILYVVSDTNRKMPWVPYESCDEFYSLSLYHHDAAVDHGVDIFMVNTLDEITSKHPTNHKPSDSALKIIADSGGFQISNGQYSYINPKHLVEWYNHNVDYGIVLDIPINISSDTWRELAEIQNKNTSIMLKHKTPELELINVIQGITPADRRTYRKIVERENINRIALGGLQSRLPIEMLSSALLTMTEGKKYDQYHVLGVAQSLKALLLVYLSNTEICKYITFDAASSTLHAVNNAMLFLPSSNKPMSIVKFTVNENYHPSVHSLTSCNCPVCRAVKYTDVFSILSGHKKVALLAMHNLTTYIRYFNMMKDIFASNTPNDTKKLIKDCFNKQDGHDFALGVDFIENVREKGLEKTNQKYNFYIQKPKPLMTSLFEDNLRQKRYKVTKKHYVKRPDEFLIRNKQTLQGAKKMHVKPKVTPSKLRGLKK